MTTNKGEKVKENCHSSKLSNEYKTAEVYTDLKKDVTMSSESMHSSEQKQQEQAVEEQHLSGQDIDLISVTNNENHDCDIDTNLEKDDIALLMEEKQDGTFRQNSLDNQNNDNNNNHDNAKINDSTGTVENTSETLDGEDIIVVNDTIVVEKNCNYNNKVEDAEEKNSGIDIDMDKKNGPEHYHNNIISNLPNGAENPTNSSGNHFEMKENNEDNSSNSISNCRNTSSAKRKRGNSLESTGGGNASSNGTPSATKMKRYYRELHKMTRQAVLERICERMYEQDKKGEKLKVSRLIEELKADHPWLTRFIVYRAQEKFKDSKVKEQEKIQLLQEEKDAQGLLVKQKKQKLSLDNYPQSSPINKQEQSDNHVYERTFNSIKAEDSSGYGSDYSDHKREGRKKGKKGGPRRKFATLYHVPEGAEHAVDVTRVCHSTSFLNKLKRTSRGFLADAYSKMDEAKKEREKVHQGMEDLIEKKQEKEAELAVLQDQLLEQKELLEVAKQKIQLASEYVTEQELKVECPWNANYNKLLKYKTQHGNIDLPTRCPQDKQLDSLCCWVQAQKQKYQDYREGCKNTFKPHRIHLLEKLGIEWNVRNNLWNKHFETLLKFKEEFGHVVVPTKTPPPGYKELAAWVVYQRDQYKSIMDETVRQRRPVKPAISLTKDRIRKLKDVGFVFNVFDERWDIMYKALKEYLQKEGQFPTHKKNSPKLHHWMQRQRYQYELYHTGQRQTKRCRLTKDRIELLDEIEFPWRQEDHTEDKIKVSPSKNNSTSTDNDNEIATASKGKQKKQIKLKEKPLTQQPRKKTLTSTKDEKTKTKTTAHNHAHHGDDDITKVYGDIQNNIDINNKNNKKDTLMTLPAMNISTKTDDTELQQLAIDSSQEDLTTAISATNNIGENILLQNQFYARYPLAVTDQSPEQAGTDTARKGNNDDTEARDDNAALFPSKQSV